MSEKDRTDGQVAGVYDRPKEQPRSYMDALSIVSSTSSTQGLELAREGFRHG